MKAAQELLVSQERVRQYEQEIGRTRQIQFEEEQRSERMRRLTEENERREQKMLDEMQAIKHDGSYGQNARNLWMQREQVQCPR